MDFEDNGSQFVTQEMLIPGQKCGLIIGKNGETINNMQETIGVKMLLIQDNQSMSYQPKPLRITGSADKVEQAKQAVELLLASDESNRGGNPGSGGMMNPSFGMPQQQRSMGEIIVPRSSVGIIIGKGGETIKRLSNESGTKIQFKPDDNPMTQERCAVIHGTPSQIQKATSLIWNLVNQLNGNPQQQEVCLMHVPASKIGMVIGRNGETIKSICAESGANVELSRDSSTSPGVKVFVIKGSEYQIHVAKHIIRIKVGDIPPETPIPAFQPMQVQGGFQQPHATGIASPTAQYSQVSSTTQQNYGSQQSVNSQQSGRTCQSPVQAQPSINPATGQLDYSAQWIEYYRSLGMHDHAAAIEQQIRGVKSEH